MHDILPFRYIRNKRRPRRSCVVVWCDRYPKTSIAYMLLVCGTLVLLFYAEIPKRNVSFLFHSIISYFSRNYKFVINAETVFYQPVPFFTFQLFSFSVLPWDHFSGRLGRLLYAGCPSCVTIPIQPGLGPTPVSNGLRFPVADIVVYGSGIEICIQLG